MRYNPPGGWNSVRERRSDCSEDKGELHETKKRKRREELCKSRRPNDNGGLDSEMRRERKRKRNGDGENMAIVNKRAKDERSLWPYTNLRLLYWPRINHRGHWGCPSRTLAQKTIHTKNPQMNCVHLQVPV
jgi:hypothetical protein